MSDQEINMTETNTTPNHTAPPNAINEPLKRTRLTSLMLSLVGSPDPQDTSRSDYKHTTLSVPLLLGTSALAGVGVGVAMNAFMDLGTTGSTIGGLCGAFFYAAMDRAIIGTESRNKALRKAEGVMYPNRPWHKRFGSFLGHHIAMGSRLAVSIVFSIVVTEVLMSTYLYKAEIDSILEDRQRKANSVLIEKSDALKQEYDTVTNGLRVKMKNTLDELSKAEEINRNALKNKINDNPELQQTQDQLLEQRAELIRLQQDKADLLEQRIEQDKIKEAEETGAAIDGTTGIAGQGKRFQAANIKSKALQENIKAVDEQISAIRDNITSLEQVIASIQRQKGDNAALTDSNIQKLQEAANALGIKIEERNSNRADVFTKYDEQIRKDPGHVEKQAGLLPSLSALDELIKKPENQGTPRALYYALLLLLIGLDTSPVILAAMRKSTRSEIKAAFEELRQNAEDGFASEHRIKILEKALLEETQYMKENDIAARGPLPDGNPEAKVVTNGNYKRLSDVAKPMGMS